MLENGSILTSATYDAYKLRKVVLSCGLSRLWPMRGARGIRFATSYQLRPIQAIPPNSIDRRSESSRRLQTNTLWLWRLIGASKMENAPSSASWQRLRLKDEGPP